MNPTNEQALRREAQQSAAPHQGGHHDGYLDAAATAPMRPEARAAMIAALDGGAANASSVHQAGHRARALIDGARTEIAAAFDALPAEVVFTAGGTEANNLAIIGLAVANPRGRHLVTTPIEHPSVLESCRYLERVFGFTIEFAEVDATGRVEPRSIAALVRSDTALVSVGLANAEVGTVQDLPGIAEIARTRGALMHTDAVQAAAALPVRFSTALRGDDPTRVWPGPGIDAMTIAGHKFGGPQGTGALLLRPGIAVEPLIHGGGQERGRRAGTENVAGIAGFAAAVAAARSDIGGRGVALMHSRDALIDRVLAEVPGSLLTGHRTERLPGHASFAISGVSGESLLVALDAAGYAVSSGSACAAGSSDPSPVLLALGLSADLAQTGIRLTLASPLADAAIDRIIAVLRAETDAAALRRGARRRQRGIGERAAET
ncbi:cysteine desulfurase family protein [Leucobacter sp. USCH14]|uniref:cysteine desulfurase family protein n=1 Tax=Leucobacter sp. USCH14 TaxID=3024838 RepID=UPI0030979263